MAILESKMEHVHGIVDTERARREAQNFAARARMREVGADLAYENARTIQTEGQKTLARVRDPLEEANTRSFMARAERLDMEIKLIKEMMKRTINQAEIELA